MSISMLSPTFNPLKFDKEKNVKNRTKTRHITYCKSNLNNQIPVIKSKHTNILNFNNWAPELINARCAMVGIISGLGFEYVNHISLKEQFIDFYPSFLLVSILITLGTLKTGEPKPDEPNTLFTPDAEIFNGRIAMIAFSLKLISDFM